MNWTKFFYSLIGIIVSIFFIFLGVIWMIIPWSSKVKAGFIHIIQNHSIAISLFGFTFIVIGSAIVMNLILNTRRKYYHIRSGQNAVEVDENVIFEYMENYWKKLFPKHEIPCRITIEKNKINVVADLPKMPIPDQKMMIERIEMDVGNMFARVLGYRNEFILSISFESEEK